MANKIHPKMDRSSRAKQFMPFDALKGFREALAEKERAVEVEFCDIYKTDETSSADEDLRS